ncbi:MAG: hypothetical protein J0I80_16735 [Sphingomonas sp.]|nr:hypothetical protein [Sphingomonas sp.]
MNPSERRWAIAFSAIYRIGLQLKIAATQHRCAIGRYGDAAAGKPMELDMALWKKIVAAYIAAAGTSGAFMLNGFY